MKTFKCPTFSALSLEGTRAEAIRMAINFLAEGIQRNLVKYGSRYTWRAEDESGFTIQIKGPSVQWVAVCVSKWNATRDKAERAAEDNFRNRHED